MLLGDLAFFNFFNTLHIPSKTVIRSKRTCQSYTGESQYQWGLAMQRVKSRSGQDVKNGEQSARKGRTGKHKGGMEMSWLDKEKAWIEKKGFGSCTAVWKMRGNWDGWAVGSAGRQKLDTGHWCDAVRRKGLNPNGWSVWSPPQWYALQWPALSSSHLQMT